MSISDSDSVSQNTVMYAVSNISDYNKCIFPEFKDVYHMR